MPRANRRRRDVPGLDIERAVGGFTREESHPDGRWYVRQVAGRQESRTYLCPGCQQMFGGGAPHIVAWPADGLGGLDDRRHWHTTCWRARGRRHPRGATR